MNALRTARVLNSAAWRRRYRSAFSSLLHFRLTLQTLALPDEPVPEQLSESDLRIFLDRLLTDLHRFVVREVRFLEAIGGDLRRWRIGEILPLLELFDQTAGLDLEVVPSPIEHRWRKVCADLVRLKARVVHLHVFS